MPLILRNCEIYLSKGVNILLGQPDIIQEHHSHYLQNGLVLTPTFTTLKSDGLIPTLLANYTDNDIYLQPRTPLGVISQADVEQQVTLHHVNQEEIGKSVLSSITALMNRMTISDEVTSDTEKLQRLEELLLKHQERFIQPG